MPVLLTDRSVVLGKEVVRHLQRKDIFMIADYERAQAKDRFDSEKKANILITSAAGKIPLIHAVRQAVAKTGASARVIAADSDEKCLSRHLADDFWCMPPLTAFEEGSVLLESLLARGIAYIIPTRDGELTFWSSKKAFLDQHGIQVMVSQRASIDNCLDKLYFYNLCRENNIPAIPTEIDIDRLPMSNSYVVKERFGAGSLHLVLDLKRNDAVRHATFLNNPIFQPFVRGKEYSIDAYVDKSNEIKGVVCRVREIVKNGESQITVTCNDAGLEEKCRRYIKAFNLYGHIMLQLIISVDGEIHLVECNARFGGASTLSLAAGLDSFYWFLLESRGADIRSIPFHRKLCALRQVRVPQDVIFVVDENE